MTRWSRRQARMALCCAVGLVATAAVVAARPALAGAPAAANAVPVAANAVPTAPNAVPAAPVRQVEKLDRGLVAVPTTGGILVSWRLFGPDGTQTGFNVYRNGTRLTASPVTGRTNYLDATGTTTARYAVAAVTGGTEGTRSAEVQPWATDHLDIPIQKPAGGKTPDGVAYTYSANDASVADLDGDGQYEIVLKWYPSNAKDNSQSGYTGEVFLDAYKFNGTRLWRISMGRNIRAGAHYTQFLAYDFDRDGKAEVVAKTADGTKDGTGKVIGSSTADYRSSTGYVLSGPEFLTVFNGVTGAAIVTTTYDPARGDPCDWGDCYGNRVDRFLAGVAYFDGVHPSIVMTRGYYTRTVIVAYDFAAAKLTKRWRFDTDTAGSQYEGAGNHQLSVADVDGDGKDEIVFGSLTIDDNGKLLHANGLKHGDALHVGDLNPNRAGMEVFDVHESTSSPYGLEMHDAKTGKVLFGTKTGIDTARGMAADVDPRYPGDEVWATDGDWNSPTGWLLTADGKLISKKIPAADFAIWWDGDLQREILDHNWNATTGVGVGTIGKWDYLNSKTVNLLTATGTFSNNYTKGTPVLQADLFGDWREEVIWRTEDSNALRMYATPYTSPYAFPTLMQDPQYRLSIAWQNVGYNQPPHTSYYIGSL